MQEDNQIYSFSARLSDDKFEVNYLKTKCAKKGLNFSQIIIKLIRKYNADEQRRTKD